MRSKNCTMEGPDEGRIQPTAGLYKQDEEKTPEIRDRKPKVQREEKDGKTSKRAQKPAERKKTALPDLSKKELLHLLGVMEGEVQVEPNRHTKP